MARRDYTQKRLAAEIGISEQRLSRNLKNSTLGTDDAEKIIKILAIDDPTPIFFSSLVT